MNETMTSYIEGRSCAGCTMCCKLLSIEVLNKPRQRWCTHCDIGVGCKIYDERPEECRTFTCGYLADVGIGEHWKPAVSKMVVSLATNAKRIVVYVDSDRPDAWRKEPYYTDLRNWSKAAAQNRGELLVSQGRDMFVITPEGETNLGQVGDDQVIIALRKSGSGGSEFDHVVLDLDDPIFEKMKLLKDPDAAKAASPEELSEARREVDAWWAQQEKQG